MSDRARILSRLKDHTFDLLVLGGGITGAGIARDAALRGLSVALVEKGDLARGTSSASSKLIHGGLRYLEHLEFGLVFEGTRERWLLTRNAPHLAEPLPFLFPVYKGARVGMLQLTCGMWLYDALAAFRNYRRHELLSPRKTHRAEPALLARGLRGSARYYDCRTNDARLTLETALDAEHHGAVVATYVEAVGIETDSIGITRGLRVRDALAASLGDGTSELFPVRARVTVVAAGPWTDRILAERGRPPCLRPTKGAHIVLDAKQLPLRHAVVLTSVRDGRVLFAIPWDERTIVGTTDTDDDEPPDRVEASAEDVAYLLETANHYFPSLCAGADDIIATWAGLRPLMQDPESDRASDVSREHALLNIDPGLLAIVGGKLTTYRLMAEQAVDRVLGKLGAKAKLDPCRTREVPLIGASDPAALADIDARARELAREYALEDDVARHLVRSYGLRAPEVLAAGKEAGVRPGRLVPDLPYLVDEVVFGALRERAERLDDVLRRRTQVFLKARDQGVAVAEEAARVLGEVLGWDREREQLEVRRYRQLVALSRRYKGRRMVPPTSRMKRMPADA